MLDTKSLYGKSGKRQGYHVIISFTPEESVTPAQAKFVAEGFIGDILNGEYETVYGIHTDKEHTHVHIIWNSVNLVTGQKYNSPKGNWKHHLQPTTNKYCGMLGLEIMPAEYAKEPVNMSKEKWEYEQSFKDYILDNARLCLSYAGSLEHFIFLMKRMGYEFKGKDYLSVRIPAMKLNHRLDKLDTIFSRGELPAIMKYGYGQYYRRYNTKSVLYVKRANLTPLQKKYYAKMYRLGLIEKKCYQYHSADMAKEIKRMQFWQDQYLFICKNDISSITDLMRLHDEAKQTLEEVDSRQKVSFTARDQGSGLASVTLKRFSDVTKSWSTVKTWNYNGSTSYQSGTYTETSEGVFYYQLTIKDKAGNTTTKTSSNIYLDHSNPVIYGVENTVTSWTKVVPTISVSATDYLLGTSYEGSGVRSIVIKDDSGRQVSSGVASTNYILSDSYQGIHTWTIVATDNVEHTSSKMVTTKFDKTGPHCSSLIARPNSWSAGNGTVTFTVQDPWSGLSTVILQRYSYVTRTWENVQSCNYYGTTSAVSGSYTETAEGVFYYRLWMSDVLGNTSTTDSDTIYLDHSNPLIHGVENTVTDWTNVAPVISVSGTDYLIGTTYTGSGLRSIVIKDDAGNVVASGVTSTSYTLATRYEGIHTWYITATDNVGHTSSRSVTTKYDCTKPGIDGTEITYVRPDGVTVSGYCQDNIINQHMDDEIRRSPNGANASSGLKSVILYRVTCGNKEVIYGDRTKAFWNFSDTHSWFDMYYEITADEKMVDYYEIIVTDFAGNRTKKKLTSQYSLLTWFHTSIDRSSYN